MCSIFAILGDVYDGEIIPVQAFLMTIGNPSLLCILGSRMFFNLKEAGEAGVNEGTNLGSHWLPTISSIYFGKPNIGNNQ